MGMIYSNVWVSSISRDWHQSKIIPNRKNLILIFMTQMKGFEYSQKEIFESMVYDAIL